MTPTIRKQAERQRRKERGEVALSGWLSAEDHAALTQMARDSGMTQGQVVSRLIGMRVAVMGLERVDVNENYDLFPDEYGDAVRHSDLTAVLDLLK